MHHANVFVDNLGDLPPAVDSELRRILGVTSLEDHVINSADEPHCSDVAERYRSDSQRNARECSLEGDWKASLFGLLRTLSEHQAAGGLKVHIQWAHRRTIHWDDDDRDTRTPRSSQSALPDFDPTEAANTAASIFNASAPSLPSSTPSVTPTTSSEAADPYHISTPKPDITVALAHTGFEGRQQRRLVDHQAAASILSDPHAADMGTRFPFLIVEAKGQSLNGSVVCAQNQAAISGACMLTILRDLSNQADWNASSTAECVTGMQQIPALCFSLVTAGPTHELAVHFLHHGAFHMYCFKSCRTTLSPDSRILVHFLHKILLWGCGRFKDAIVEQLEKLLRCSTLL
ncbi:hypothetical protein IAQ61_005970 [Plenodomus lingam]|uniref:uncharacterized protein n=1 Tax=Leptosphaeria maculans TaxID=5022 RepID=UPI0033331C8C|nr:hypothetical protein IAQ61_005970 [Plenodomus lingam]